MRGIIFTSLLELIEEEYDIEVLDTIIVSSQLANDGAYSATGDYEPTDFLKLLEQWHIYTKLPKELLLEKFGQYLFKHLRSHHMQINNFNHASILDFLEEVETYIHIEVKKLYPTAQLPQLKLIQKSDKKISFYYISARNLHHLAKGLILGASEYFNRNIDIQMRVESNQSVYFCITLI